MLSPKAQEVINKYFSLPFQGIINVRCPYFNNARRNLHGQLRVLIGKGSPDEIVEEAIILSKQYHHNIFDNDGFCCVHGAHSNDEKADDIRKFLINNDLGVDCSGFISHILIEHYKETKNINIATRFHFWPIKRLWRYLIAKLRPIENMSVRVYAKDENTEKIADARSFFNWIWLQPADLITMIETGPNKKRNHMILIVQNEESIIKYVHARAWSSEGKFGHGVSVGQIKITNPGKNLFEQTWEENGKINSDNETFLEADGAKICEVRRIKF